MRAGEETSAQRNEELDPDHGVLWRTELVGDWRKREFMTRKIREGPVLAQTMSRALWQVGKLKQGCEAA